MRRGKFILLCLFIAATSLNVSYAGQETRSVKALSQSEIDGLRDGKGMSLALAAELNGHPGPMHVLELADRLKLSSDQRNRTQLVFDAMKSNASRLGAEVIAQEEALDAQFRSADPDPSKIESLSVEIGRARGALRAVHLNAHLAMNEILDTDQRRTYAILRGYGGDPGRPPSGPHPGHSKPHGH